MTARNGSPFIKIFEDEGLPFESFHHDERYSRLEPCMCGFLSHRELWKKSVLENKHILILEHDAIFMEKPKQIKFNKVISLGAPSYGRYRKPNQAGVYPLFSKVGGYLPGAHAYVVSPTGAQELLNKALTNPAPTDLFLNKTNFPWIQEYYPWPIKADDRISTIQKEEGCLAKHNYEQGNFKIV